MPVSVPSPMLAVPKNSPRTVDELLRTCHREDPERLAVVFASLSSGDYRVSTRDLDTLVFTVARRYSSFLKPRKTSAQRPEIIGILGAPDFSYLISLLAIAKLGHAALLLSPRLSAAAYQHLLEKSGAKALLVQADTYEKIAGLAEAVPNLLVQQILQVGHDADIKCDVSIDSEDTHLTSGLDLMAESEHPTWVLHSSGSTGMPKLVYITNRSAFARYYDNIDFFGYKNTLTTLPIFHAHGMSSFFRALVTKKLVYVYDPRMPVTLDRLQKIVSQQDFRLFSAVPYTIKLLAETAEGVAFLRRFEIVTSGGGPVAENLGDWLVEQGVKLTSIYGSSETGVLLTSARPDGDKAWNYLRPPDGIGHLLKFDHQVDNLYELIAPSNWPPIAESNSPDGSWRTKDLFIEHPHTKNAWKYIGRFDDVIVLENGEKVNPVDVEGQVSKHHLVDQCLAVGSGKSTLGLAIVLSNAAKGQSAEESLNQLWPSIDGIQSVLPEYARLSKDKILLLPAGTDYPRTDKGTVVRRLFCDQFAESIESLYAETEASERQQLSSVEALTQLIAENIGSVFKGLDNAPINRTDFFAAGMDSLQATKVREMLIRNVDLRGNQLPLNIVFDNPNVEALATEVFRIASGQEKSEAPDTDAQVQNLIRKYSSLPAHTGQVLVQQHQCVAMTGATGSLGAHLLSQLLKDNSIPRVYCLVRADDPEKARKRIEASLISRRLPALTTALDSGRLIALPASLSEPSLNLSESEYTTLKQSVTVVYHCAWTVNFNQRLQSFERDNIQGLHNLLKLCMETENVKPARMVFFSSISSIMRSKQQPLPEQLPQSISEAQVTGYAQSKYVAEHICQKVAERQPNFQAVILRIGQIVGDTKEGVWNVDEATPLTLQSAVTIGCLPRLDDVIRWIPVDQVASVAIELYRSARAHGLNGELQTGIARGDCRVYNLVNPNTLRWTEDLLPLLKDAGLSFEAVSHEEWLTRLQAASQDPVTNPPVKLMEYYKRQVEAEKPSVALEWDTRQARASSATFESLKAPSSDLIAIILAYLKSKWAI